MARKKSIIKSPNTIMYGILVTPELHHQLKLAGSKKVRELLPELVQRINGKQLNLNF
jgi:hypothetical protein